jgi:hypothetical protein
MNGCDPFTWPRGIDPIRTLPGCSVTGGNITLARISSPPLLLVMMLFPLASVVLSVVVVAVLPVSVYSNVHITNLVR